MSSNYELIVDGVKMKETNIEWSDNENLWYVSIIDTKYEEVLQGLGAASYCAVYYSGRELVYQDWSFKHLLDESVFKSKDDYLDAKKRVATFMNHYVEENKFYFLLDKPHLLDEV